MSHLPIRTDVVDLPKYGLERDVTDFPLEAVAMGLHFQFHVKVIVENQMDVKFKIENCHWMLNLT